MDPDDVLSLLSEGSDFNLVPTWAGRDGFRCMLCGSGAESIKSFACKKCAGDWALLCKETRKELTDMARTPVGKHSALLLNTKITAIKEELKEARAAEQLEKVMIADEARDDAVAKAKARKEAMFEKYKAAKGVPRTSYDHPNMI